MHTYISLLLSRKYLQFLGFGCACVLGSFLIGIETAGDVHPFARSQAVSIDMAPQQLGIKPGDVDGDDVLSVADVIAILEIDQGYRDATPDELKRDTDGDLRLTVKDALRVLRTIALR